MLQVKIPRTWTGRNRDGYALLIRRIMPSEGFSFLQGRFFRPGRRVDLAELWPTPDYPIVPLVVEFAGRIRPDDGRRPFPDLHVLWRYNAQRNDWEERIRFIDSGPQWLYDLREILRDEMRRPPIDHAGLAHEAITRVLRVMEGELGELEDEGRLAALAGLYDHVTSRLCRAEPARP